MFGEGVLRFVLVPVSGTPRRDPADLDRSLRSFFAQSALAQLLHRLGRGFRGRSDVAALSPESSLATRQMSISPFLNVIAAHSSEEEHLLPRSEATGPPPQFASSLQELALPCLSHTLSGPGKFLADLSPTISGLSQLRCLRLDFGWRSLYANRAVLAFRGPQGVAVLPKQ